MTTTNERNISMTIHYHTEYLVRLWLRQTKHIHDYSLPHRIFDSTMTTTNETYPWPFITTQNTWFNYDYDKWNISMIIHQNTWFNYDYDKRTKHIHDHSLPSVIDSFKIHIWKRRFNKCRSTTKKDNYRILLNFDKKKTNQNMCIHIVKLWKESINSDGHHHQCRMAYQYRYINHIFSHTRT